MAEQPMKPMLASPTSIAQGRRAVSYAKLLASGDWIADVKWDGVRAMAHWDGTNVRLTNRVDADTTYRYPEIVEALKTALAGRPPLVLDGELITTNGRFESIARRDAQSDPRAAMRMAVLDPAIYIAFDLPSHGGQLLDRLDALAALDLWNDRLRMSPHSDSIDFARHVFEWEMEGVILKHKRSAYAPGRSRLWLKFKRQDSVTVLVNSYAPGNGHRAEFGAMDMWLIDEDGELTSVGRVGTGFTDRQIRELKESIDSGAVLTVEVTCLGRTSSNQLRMPVFQGVRTDVSMLDCNTTQLNALPSS